MRAEFSPIAALYPKRQPSLNKNRAYLPVILGMAPERPKFSGLDPFFVKDYLASLLVSMPIIGGFGLAAIALKNKFSGQSTNKPL